MAYSMTYDQDSVSLVGQSNITIKVPNPKYVMTHTWSFIKDTPEIDFIFFHYCVARALLFHEIEHSEKSPCRVVIQDHPDPKYQVVLSYDETSVKLEALGYRVFYTTRFPHFDMEQLLVKLQNKDPQEMLRIFQYESIDVQHIYEYPVVSIIRRYFKEFEYPDELDESSDDESSDDEYLENNEPKPDPFAGLKAAGGPCACSYCSPVPAAPVKKSFWSRVCTWLRW